MNGRVEPAIVLSEPASAVPERGSVTRSALPAEVPPVKFPFAPRRRSAASLRAFTLIELLVVMAIIGLLAALLLPVMGSAKATARAVACVSNLHQAGVALQLYIQDNNNRLPIMRDYTASMDTNTVALPTPGVVLAAQLGNTNVLRCPADTAGVFEQTGSSYSWNSLLNGQDAGHLQVFGMAFNPTQIPLMFDKEGFHSARGAGKAVNYLYGDTHIQNLLVVEGTTQ